MDNEDFVYLVAAVICIVALVALISSLPHDKAVKDIAQDCERYGAFYIGEVRYTCEEQTP